jgi:hypothetical protein
LSKSEVTFAIQPSPLRRSFMQSDSRFLTEDGVPALLLRPSNPARDRGGLSELDWPGALVGQDSSVHLASSTTASARRRIESTQTRLVLGARARFLKQDWEVAYAYNKSEGKGLGPEGLLAVRLCGDRQRSGQRLQPFHARPVSATTAACSSQEYTGSTLNANETNAVDGKLTGRLNFLPALCSMQPAPPSTRKSWS